MYKKGTPIIKLLVFQQQVYIYIYSNIQLIALSASVARYRSKPSGYGLQQQVAGVFFDVESDVATVNYECKSNMIPDMCFQKIANIAQVSGCFTTNYNIHIRYQLLRSEMGVYSCKLRLQFLYVLGNKFVLLYAVWFVALFQWI